MTKTQKIICYTLLFSGMFFYPLSHLIGYRSFTFAWIGFALMGIGGIYGVIVLYRAKRFDKFKRAGLSVGVMLVTLLMLYLIWGRS